MSKAKVWLRRFRLSLLFAAIVSLVMFFSLFLLFCGIQFFVHIGLVSDRQFGRLPLFLFCLTSTLVGTILAAFVSKVPLRPMRAIMDAADRIANGDYSVRIHLRGPEEFKTLSEKFNHMAEELGSVEMLRNDFVSSFSHEFKTPIVSIRGFARALKWDDLSEKERAEYLDIIISESERLSDLASNVLYLSRLENQAILTDRSVFNVSEQIRLVIALLDSKAMEKKLDIKFDNGEYFIDGNKEMIKQVWINLLDNAVKFSPEGGRVEIQLRQAEGFVYIRITNDGAGFSPEVQSRLFDKFYQGDASHSGQGNGLGLSIAKKIVDLHGGRIYVLPGGNRCIFEIAFSAASGMN